jgi:hypothetical protein
MYCQAIIEDLHWNQGYLAWSVHHLLNTEVSSGFRSSTRAFCMHLVPRASWYSIRRHPFWYVLLFALDGPPKEVLFIHSPSGNHQRGKRWMGLCCAWCICLLDCFGVHMQRLHQCMRSNVLHLFGICQKTTTYMDYILYIYVYLYHGRAHGCKALVCAKMFYGMNLI